MIVIPINTLNTTYVFAYSNKKQITNGQNKVEDITMENLVA